MAMRESVKQPDKPRGLRATKIPVRLNHSMRKRLWWRAQRMAFAAWKHGGILKTTTRKEWTRIVYLILIRYPDDYIGRLL